MATGINALWGEKVGSLRSCHQTSTRPIENENRDPVSINQTNLLVIGYTALGWVLGGRKSLTFPDILQALVIGYLTIVYSVLIPWSLVRKNSGF